MQQSVPPALGDLLTSHSPPDRGAPLCPLPAPRSRLTILMDLELLTIGTELLLGFTLDTNGAHIAQTLSGAGIRVTRRTSVADDGTAIADAVDSALRRTGMVITTGGLGPTRDDISKHAVADLLGMPLEFHDAIWDSIVERFKRLGREPSPLNRSQAMVPQGATVLPNRWGTAPGLWLESPRGIVIMLPGVPSEMKRLLEHEVLPRLVEHAGGAVVRSRMLRTTGVAESALAEHLGEIEALIAPLSLAYLPGLDGVDLRLTAWSLAPADADAELAKAAALIRERAGTFIYGEDDATLAQVVVHALRDRRLRIAVAESCTGGLVGGRLTDVPGSSAVFQGGIIAYDNAVKVGELDVRQSDLEQHGAVSEPVARAMAEGVRRRMGTDLGVAVTGIAGPDGGTPEKPVGTVWFALADGAGTVAVRAQFPRDRAEVRARATQAALNLVLRHLRRGAVSGKREAGRAPRRGASE